MTARLCMVLYWAFCGAGCLCGVAHLIILTTTFGEGGCSWCLNIFFGVPTVLSYLAGRAARYVLAGW
jgi:hypothetical protein